MPSRSKLGLALLQRDIPCGDDGDAADLQDFAIGFALTQGIIASAAEIESLEIEPIGQGIDCRLWIAPERAEALSKRRRALAGPTGCGVCGVEGIDDALPHVPHVSSAFRPTPQMVMAAIASLPSAQTLGVETRARHAAGYWTPEAGLVAIREDVGRHNALDKLAGALASPLSREAEEKAGAGLILLTSASRSRWCRRPPPSALLFWSPSRPRHRLPSKPRRAPASCSSPSRARMALRFSPSPND